MHTYQWKPPVILCLVLSLSAASEVHADPIIIFNPDTQIGNMSTGDNANPDEEVIKAADTITAPPLNSGLTQTMKLTTQNQVNGEFWKVRDGTSGSWSGTQDALSDPIEIELYITSEDAVNLPDAGVPQNLDREFMEFRFGNNGSDLNNRGNNQVISVRLTRRFFLTYDATNGVEARADRTDRWIVLSIQRGADGHPVGFQLGSYDTGSYLSLAARTDNDEVPGLPNAGEPGDINSEVELRHYPHGRNGNLVDWSSATSKRIDVFGQAPDEFSFNVGRIAVGQLVPEPAALSLLACGGALIMLRRR